MAEIVLNAALKMPANKRPGSPGYCDRVSIMYNGISSSLDDILLVLLGSHLTYSESNARPEKHVVTDMSMMTGTLTQSAFLAFSSFLKVRR